MSKWQDSLPEKFNGYAYVAILNQYNHWDVGLAQCYDDGAFEIFDHLISRDYTLNAGMMFKQAPANTKWCPLPKCPEIPEVP